MHNCLNYIQFLLPTPWFGTHKCWKILDYLRRPTATLYHLIITKEYSHQLCLLHFLNIFYYKSVQKYVIQPPEQKIEVIWNLFDSKCLLQVIWNSFFRNFMK